MGERVVTDEEVVWIDASCERLKIVGGGVDVFWYLSLTKLITTFWSDIDESVEAVWERRSLSSVCADAFVIVYESENTNR